MSRCNAISKRSREQCKNWAIRNKTKCKFHGGKATGPRTINGKIKSINGNLIHGFRAKATVEYLCILRNTLRQKKIFLKNCINLTVK